MSSLQTLEGEKEFQMFISHDFLFYISMCIFNEAKDLYFVSHLVLYNESFGYKIVESNIILHKEVPIYKLQEVPKIFAPP